MGRRSRVVARRRTDSSQRWCSPGFWGPVRTRIADRTSKAGEIAKRVRRRSAGLKRRVMAMVGPPVVVKIRLWANLLVEDSRGDTMGSPTR